MMRVRCFLAGLGYASILAANAASSYGQAGYGRSAGSLPTFRAPGSYQRVSGRSNPALEFFGGGRSLQFAPSGRTVPMPAPAQVHSRAMAKPYTGVQQAGSVTPFLALDQRESDIGLPNYYLFVKPQLDQHAINQRDQLQYRRMQQQLRRASVSGIVPTSASGGIPTTGHSTQFMNNGGYYPTLQR